ncbi:LSM domain protein, partial [Opisthorchis viverrini]
MFTNSGDYHLNKVHAIVAPPSGADVVIDNDPIVDDFWQMSHKQTPRDFLKLIIGRPVVVKLNSGADYRGVLISLDGYMNVVLEQTEEYVDGQLKNKYGDTFIRGNNGLFVILPALNNARILVFYISTQKR